jgi:NADH:ubiquinone oxidoreductase subunit 6 (subunit J)
VTILLACSVLTLVSAVVATFVGDIKRSVLALWIAGLGVGGLYLSLGAELLAITQWIVATLVAISFIFYAVMFGEYGFVDPRPLSRKIASALMPLTVGGAFAGVLWVGIRHLEPRFPAQGTERIASLGKALAGSHLLSLEVLALTLLLVVVGSGVVARPERAAKERAEEER